MENLTTEDKETLETLIRNEFNNIDFSLDWIYEKSNKLIALAEKLKLTELVNELKETA